MPSVEPEVMVLVVRSEGRVVVRRVLGVVVAGAEVSVSSAWDVSSVLAV